MADIIFGYVFFSVLHLSIGETKLPRRQARQAAGLFAFLFDISCTLGSYKLKKWMQNGTMNLRCLWLLLFTVCVSTCAPSNRGDAQFPKCFSTERTHVSGDTLCLKGEIRSDFYEALTTSAGNFSAVFIDSPGGDIASTIRIANEITNKDYSLYIGDNCSSACAQFLLYSSKRIYVRINSQFSIHTRIKKFEEPFSRESNQCLQIDRIDHQQQCVRLLQPNDSYWESLLTEYSFLKSANPKVSQGFLTYERSLARNSEMVSKFIEEGGLPRNVYLSFGTDNLSELGISATVLGNTSAQRAPYRCQMRSNILYIDFTSCDEVG